MSTSGGSSGGGGGFPILATVNGNDVAITDTGGALNLSVFDHATGNWGAFEQMFPNVAQLLGYWNAGAASQNHSAGVTATADDNNPSSVLVAVDGLGLTVDANGNPVWNGTLPPADIRVATAHLNAAALQTLFSAPTALVAAPGAGKMIEVVQGLVQFVAGLDVYYFDLGLPGIFYGTVPAANGLVGSTFDAAISVQPAASRMMLIASPAATSLSYANATVANKGLIVGGTVANPETMGPIVTATLAAGGLAYAVGDTGTIGPDPDSGDATATYIITAVAAVTGAVTAFTVTAAGHGYTVNSNPISTAIGGAQPGIGDGNFAVNVTAVPAPDGDLYVTALYRVHTLN